MTGERLFDNRLDPLSILARRARGSPRPSSAWLLDGGSRQVLPQRATPTAGHRGQGPAYRTVVGAGRAARTPPSSSLGLRSCLNPAHGRRLEIEESGAGQPSGKAPCPPALFLEQLHEVPICLVGGTNLPPLLFHPEGRSTPICPPYRSSGRASMSHSHPFPRRRPRRRGVRRAWARPARSVTRSGGLSRFTLTLVVAQDWPTLAAAVGVGVCAAIRPGSAATMFVCYRLKGSMGCGSSVASRTASLSRSSPVASSSSSISSEGRSLTVLLSEPHVSTMSPIRKAAVTTAAAVAPSSKSRPHMRPLPWTANGATPSSLASSSSARRTSCPRRAVLCSSARSRQ